ncbi:MAG: hypothetical protein JSS66_00440 [Armatimonadetes bacterium]|nr:hypothetical protein [Armatimonadota bacterium]
MSENIVAILGVLTGFGLVVVLPIVAVFANHQRRMAEIARGNTQPDARSMREIELLQAQINDLRTQLHEHIVRTDQPVTPPQVPPQTIEQRLNG